MSVFGEYLRSHVPTRHSVHRYRLLRPFAKPLSQPNLWRQAEVDRILQYYIETAWSGRMTSRAALAAANRHIQTVLDEQPS